jgi:hypothetical protein
MYPQNKLIPADMQVVSVMIWLDVVTSGICSPDAVTDNDTDTKKTLNSSG